MGRTGFTTEFGMGSGVTPHGESPTKPVRTCPHEPTSKSVHEWTDRRRNHQSGYKATCHVERASRPQSHGHDAHATTDSDS